MSPFSPSVGFGHVRVYSVPDLDTLHASKHIVEIQVEAHQGGDDAFDGKMMDSISPVDERFTAHTPLMHGDHSGTKRRGAFVHKILGDR